MNRGFEQRPLVGLLAVILTLLALAAAPAAQADNFSWSVNSLGLPSQDVNFTALACAPGGDCSAVDSNGQVVGFDPTSVSGGLTLSNLDGSPTNLSNGLTSCQEVGACEGLTSVSCPGANQCTAVDPYDAEVTYDPTSPSYPLGATGSDVGPQRFHNGNGDLVAVSCPSPTVCVELDSSGSETTFDPTQSPPTYGTTTDVGNVNLSYYGSGQLMSCDQPSGTSQDPVCAVVTGNDELTFDPKSPPASPAVPVEVDSADTLTSVSCVATGATTSECVAVDNSGNAIEFDPENPGNPTPVNIGSLPLNSVACLTGASNSIQCVAVDTEGNEWTFDPSNPAAATSITVEPDDISLTAVACSTTTSCVAVTRGLVIAFDPQGGTVSFAYAQAEASALHVACPSTSQCTAVDNEGDEVTFNPLSPGSPKPVGIDSYPGSTLIGLSCPTTTQCTAVDDIGYEYTFDPAAAQAPAEPVNLDVGALRAISCPSADQCTAITNNTEATFDPSNGAHVAQPIDVNQSGPYADGQLQAISCPSIDQCTAVDGSAGSEITFDPADVPYATTPALQSVGTVGDPVAISCPTAKQCTSVAGGSTATFDPADGTVTANGAIGPLGTTTALSCPAVGQCTAVDSGVGETTFWPGSTSYTFGSFVPGASGLNDVSCPSPSECVGVDNVGDAVVGTEQLMIDETRLVGPAGDPSDSYVDLYNASPSPIDLSQWQLIYDTQSGDVGTDQLSGTVPAGGHYLLTQADAYSLGSYALSDQDLDLPADSGGLSGVALIPPNGGVFDSVGENGSSLTDGTPLAVPTYPAGDNNQAAFVRRIEDGVPIDTEDNAADFQFVATDADTQSYGAGVDAVFGSPSPHSLGLNDGGTPTNPSPIQVDAIAQSYLVSPAAGESGAPNFVYTPPASGAVSATNPGTLQISRTITNVSNASKASDCPANGSNPTNSAGCTITRLWLRVTGLTTYGDVSSSQAVLEDVSTTAANGYEPVTLNSPVADAARPAGGLNSTLVIGLPNGGLTPGSSINVTITFKVYATGYFSFAYNLEDDLKADLTTGAATVPSPVATPSVPPQLAGQVTQTGATVTAVGPAATTPVAEVTSNVKHSHKKAKKHVRKKAKKHVHEKARKHSKKRAR